MQSIYRDAVLLVGWCRISDTCAHVHLDVLVVGSSVSVGYGKKCAIIYQITSFQKASIVSSSRPHFFSFAGKGKTRLFFSVFV